MQKSLGFDVSFFILGARQSSVGGGAGWRFSGGKALIQPGGQDQGLEPGTGRELKTVLVWMLLLVESSGEKAFLGWGGPRCWNRFGFCWELICMLGQRHRLFLHKTVAIVSSKCCRTKESWPHEALEGLISVIYSIKICVVVSVASEQRDFSVSSV